jgi:hypothetical protein
MEEAHDLPLFRNIAGLGGWDDRLPVESTILRVRDVLEKHKLAERFLKTVNLCWRQGPDTFAEARRSMPRRSPRRVRPVWAIHCRSNGLDRKAV